MAEKMRVHILAKELNVPSKVIIEKCRAEGIDVVKNHMSTLSAGLHATIREWFSEGTHDTVVETATRVDLGRVRLKTKRKTTAEEKTTEKSEKKTGKGAEVAVAEAPPDVSVAVESAPPSTPVAETATDAMTPPADVAAAVEPVPVEPPGQVNAPVDGAIQAAAQVSDTVAAEAAVNEPPAEVVPEKVVPAGPQNVPQKAKLQGPRVVRYEAPDYYEMERMRQRSRTPASPAAGERGPAPSARGPVPSTRGPAPGTRGPGPGERGPAPGTPGAPAPAPGGPADDRAALRRKGRINPRRAAGRVADAGEKLLEWRDRDLAERRERLAGVTGRRIRRRAAHPAAGQLAATGPITVATVSEPIHMKEFCSATGLNFMECFKVLRDEQNLVANVNMTVPTESAQLLALHFGIELEVIPARTKLDLLKDEYAALERKNLRPRPPVVTMLGHVDHGKTSLLDAIREARVVAGEDGGITQHIGAYHVQSEHGLVTFLDTPGHEAFTAMRARGAQLTDVVVLVVAADDGLMPQTIEAINHAKAAEVPIVVALNKIDLGDQNKLKIFGQLTEHELTPSGEWGGQTDVIETSATKGQGVSTLVEHLADLSALMELKADATLPGRGTVIEAETKPGVGAVARVLVQEGTLHVGDAVVCGPSAGKVRALLDDCGKRLKEAGPAIPVEVWGLDGVPGAGDSIFGVSSLQRAKEIAAETKQTRVESARIQSRKAKSLEDMVRRIDAREIPELNVIIKADVDGSVAALRQSLGEIPSDEVTLAIRHAGVGPVNDGDILLAAACGGLVLAYRVEASSTVRRVAERHSVDIRNYRVIYDVCDDIKKALEGLLKPEERIETRGTAEVRELFRLGKKIGVVAGCYVRNGMIERNQFAKVVRDGVIVREKCHFSSLRRFKDDIKEVRSGLECGIKLDGFNDIHVGDIIETYEIIEVARTL